MDTVLNELEVRIIGCLVEKELTTPEYYPLSLNALTNACNQKSNRNPVFSCDEAVVAQELERLQEKDLAHKTHTPGSRVPKYMHRMLDRLDLSRKELAVLCELMLRGPQTVGELRSHAERMIALESLEEVQQTLQGLLEHTPPLATKLPREAGRKECRYMHLLSGGIPAEKTAHQVPAESLAVQERITRLEEEIARLSSEVEGLKASLTEFKLRF